MMRKHRNTEKFSLQTLLYDDCFTQGVKITAVNTKWQLSFHFFCFFHSTSRVSKAVSQTTEDDRWATS